MSGTWPAHVALEGVISDWLQTEACLLFSSGYAANVGVVSALAGPGETVFSDALNHASIIDGCRLSRAEVVVLPHGDVQALARALSDSRGVRWVVTETYFGMDADTPDLRQIRSLCDAHAVGLIVDEAHALGVFGPEGRGLCAEVGVVPDVLVGGMGKGLGIQGGFAAGGRVYRDWLWNRARSMVFSTAPSPLLCELAMEQVRALRGADAERARLKRLETRLAARLIEGGVPTTPGRRGPVFPIVLGSEASALEAAALASERGLICQPIRPPTVPPGKSRLRVSLRADLSDSEVETIADVLVAVWRAAARREADAPGPAGPQPSTGGSPDPARTRSSRPSPARPPALWAFGASQSSESPSKGVAANPHLSRSQCEVLSSAEDLSALSGSQPERLGPQGLARGDGGVSRGSRGATARVTEGESSGAAARSDSPQSGTRTWVVLGTGTGVGKTFASLGLVDTLGRSGVPVAGLKPVETGLRDMPPGEGDAARLASHSFHVKQPGAHPLYGYPDPIAPSLAARLANDTIDISRIAAWVNGVIPQDYPGAPLARVVETAGGVFSPLGPRDTNFELARALDPAVWLLVAPDRLGVLHDVTSCLCAMAALGRLPDWLILSAPAEPDASTGTNAQELARLRARPPIIELPRNDASPLLQLLAAANIRTQR